MSFSGKVVLVTGGSAGIGAATAVRFAEEGARVAIVGRDPAKLQSVAEQCARCGPRPLSIRADLQDDAQASAVVQRTLDEFGRLDVLVNNAGILRRCGIVEKDFIATYDEVMRTNARAPLLVTSLAVPHLAATKGNIVNVSSVAGRTTSPSSFSAYKMSKAALDHFTRNAAFELAPSGIRVNAVSPGPVDTEIFETGGLPNALETFKDLTPLMRVSESNEVAELILFLASDKAKGVTGSNYVVDNGLLVK